MKRTRAVALALVNWKGVFYERYQLDQNVTALEGANGSGKTTVLIAAYVALLPDMTRLRFTNVGEHAGGSGDRGLWGRLGRLGRPSYTVIDLRLPDGSRLLAGVHLERLSEPVVEPTPFVITDLPDHVALQDVLLERGDVDGIPELKVLKEQVARTGARMHQCASAKEYFALLFERGVTPMRLATENERTKLNDMLRTSMTGGISRALTNELRSFLLKEETGLADALKRMRTSLDECRRTRIEVDESRRLEQEISAVYEAGQAMFAAAVYATRERAQELFGRVTEARRTLQAAQAHQSTAAAHCDAANQTLDTQRGELETRSAQLVVDREHLSKLQAALRVQNRLRSRTAELGTARRRFETEAQTLATAEAGRRRARDELDAANTARDRAAEGLADFQKGLDELHRRASEYRLVSEARDEARRLLGDIDAIERTRDELDRALQTTEHAVVETEQLVSTAGVRRTQHAEVMTALQGLTGEGAVENAFDRALRALQDLRELQVLADSRTSLAESLRQARKAAERQAPARALAATLGIADQAALQIAVETTEQDVIECAGAQREEEDAADEATQATIACRHMTDSLNGRLSRWREASGRATRLERDWQTSLRTEDEIRQLRTTLVRAADTHKAQIAALELTREKLNDEALALQTMGGEFPLHLLEARDAVGGELLATRYEDISVEDAATVQALLGPLATAIVVDDPASAAKLLAPSTERPDSLHLIDGDTALELRAGPHGDLVDGNAVVASHGGLRLTRLPERPSLGKRAREKRIDDLLEAELQTTAALEEAVAALQRTTSAYEQSEYLIRELDVLVQGDPTPEIAQLATTIDEQTERESIHRAAAERHKARGAELRARGKRLRELALDAWLLDGPDYAARAIELDAAYERAKAATGELERARDHRANLEAKLDVLRVPPPTEAEVETLVAKLAEHRAELAWRTRARIALRYVAEHQAALAWEDAPAVLRDRTELLPALATQLDAARALVKTSTDVLDAAEAECMRQSAVLNDADAAVKGLEHAIARDREELAALEIANVTEHDVRELESTIATNADRRSTLEKSVAKHHEELIRLDERLNKATQDVANRASELEDAEGSWRPEQDRWERLQTNADEHRVLAATLSQRFASLFAGQGSANLRSTARQHVATLKERLSKARESEQTLEAVQTLLGSQELSGDVYLQAWLSVRDWLRQRIPAQLAETNEPVEALGRLRDHLAALQTKLTRQESDLRGESEDVARNIDIHIRRAQRQVSRLNDDLQSVRFGSIRGVRLRLERVERMGQVLDALRQGEGDGLFQPETPIEDALDELFRRHGGGKLGGQRLLDYREYVDPRVEVRRQEDVEWELVNPNRLSTGEGIGIGAALMMVVLTSWERDANLLRPKRSHGALRLLFLDEANRLDRENLGVLFDLCDNLQLQLLLAAPEVARAEGNTTYRLVRRVGSDGHDEVIVTGRRVASADEKLPSPS